MTKDEYRSYIYRMIEYIAVALDISSADALRNDTCELHTLFEAAKRHHIITLVDAGLNKCGIKSDDFTEASAKAKRKSLLFDAEMAKISADLSAAQVLYLPLKGILLKKLYPQVGMREMSDIDILFEKSAVKAVRDVMLNNGYESVSFDKTNHDIYTKPPFFNVEMHRELFDDIYLPKVYEYFSKKNYLSAVDGVRCEMSAEDMYIYLTAHMYQHHMTAGTGIRPLIDLYLYLKRYGDMMDFSYICDELQKLSLTEYEASVRKLSQKLWTPENLNAQEQAELDDYIFSGLYGSKNQYIHNKVVNAINGSSSVSKLDYIKSRFKVTERKVKSSPFFSKHPKLVPLMIITRPVKAVFTRPKSILLELKELKKAEKK